MRELLEMVRDRLGECCLYEYSGAGKEHLDLRRLRRAIEVVLDKGLFDGRMTDVDMRQLPPAL